MTNTLQPVISQNRIQSLDVLRGFAIIGVLFALFMAGDNLGTIPEEKLSSVDKFINKLAMIFLHGKAYNLLAFVFGYGYALQVRLAQQKGINPLEPGLRRAGGLFIIGTLHAVFLRDGDILAPYAICSLFIILLRNSSDKKIILAMIIALISVEAYYLLMKWLGLQPAPWKQINTEGMGLVEKNLTYLQQHWYPHFIEIHSATLFLFLIGMYASRKRWLEKIQTQRRYLNLMLITGAALTVFIILVPFNKSFPSSSNFYVNLLIRIGRKILLYPFDWGIDLVYIALFLHLIRTGKAKILIGSLANMGKMSLTNYLCQDIFWIPVYLIFNFWSKFSPTQQVFMATGFSLMQIWFCGWWLKRFLFGPFEWLLRSFTYWQWQPIRKKELIR